MVTNDMVPKDSIYFLVILVCFGTVVNDMTPKVKGIWQDIKDSFGTVVNDMISKKIVHLLYLGV